MDLFHTGVTDRGLQFLLETLKNLEDLDLGQTKVTDKGMETLAKTPGLRSLNLEAEEVTNKGMKEVAKLVCLSNFALYSTKIGDAGIEVLTGLNDLNELLIAGDFTDKTLDYLLKLPNLKVLRLFCPKMTRKALIEFKKKFSGKVYRT